MFFINPPFGNYLNLPKTKSIKGSFTLEARDGLFTQILNTLRYSSKYGGWINKIGLRNKGIDWALKNYNTNDILSIAILREDDIPKLLEKIPTNQNIEINISCPNTDKKMINDKIETFINKERDWCLLKVSPNISEKEIDNYYRIGFRQFHCCNTLPIPEGGLSGKALIPYTNNKINYIKNKFKDATVISGGGITSWNDVINYKKLGADHFSVSSNFFNPIKSMNLYYDYLSNFKNK